MTECDRTALTPEAIEQFRDRIGSSRAEHPEEWRRIDADARVAATLEFVWCSSEYVAATCLRDPALLLALIESGDLFLPIDSKKLQSDLAAMTRAVEADADLLATLRNFRHRHMVRIAWRDLAGWSELSET